VAEELQTLSEEEGGTVALEEDQGATTATADDDTQQDDPIAALATELGWAPKDQFRGNPDDWKPADEFIRAGREIQRNLSRDVKGLKDTVSNMSRTSAALLEQQLERQRAELEAQHVRAVDEGDPVAARQLSRKIDRLEDPMPSVQTPPEALAFAERNKSWFGRSGDPLATARAHEIAERLAAQGYSAAEQLAAAERGVKKEFPELFPAPAKAPASVAAPASRTATTTSRETFHHMPKAAQDTARDMVERGVIPSTDPYVKNWFEQQRKVG
jgi:hypothetical protein